MKISKWPWHLTFTWPWPWVWPLTLTIWRNTLFSIFFIFFEVTWRKNVTSYVKTDGRKQKRRSIRNILQPLSVQKLWPIMWFSLNLLKSRDVKTERLWQKRNFIWNVLQPTRSLCHFRFKSYGPLSDFHKSGDLDLALYPIFKKIIVHRPWSRRHLLSKYQDDRTSGAACTSRKDRQTNKQTYRQTDRQTDRPRWPIYFAKIGDFAK